MFKNVCVYCGVARWRRPYQSGITTFSISEEDTYEKWYCSGRYYKASFPPVPIESKKPWWKVW